MGVTDPSILYDATINLFICIAGISIAIAGFAGAFDVFSKIKNLDQEKRYLRSIFLISGFNFFAATLPLVFIEYGWNINFCSGLIAAAALSITASIIVDVYRKKTRIIHKRTFYILLTLSVLFMQVSIFNAYFGSMVIYKLSLEWASFILIYRFYLFIAHVVALEER